MNNFSRRDFNKLLMLTAAAAGSPAAVAATMGNKASDEAKHLLFRIGIASWSFHMPLWRGELQATDMPRLARDMGIDAVEWSSKTFRPLTEGREAMYQPPPAAFIKSLKQASDDHGVSNPILNVGGPYYLAGVDPSTRQQALDFFLQYVGPALELGSHTMRAELYCDAPRGPGREAEAKKLAMEGINALLEQTADSGLKINIENHHGVSSQPEWLADLIRSMDNPRLGITADVNNFRVDQDMPYAADPDALPRYVDRYQSLETLMPLTTWVSAKTYAFDNTGYELSINYPRIIRIMQDAGYNGYVSIEYEGGGDPLEGVQKSVDMLRRLRQHFS